MTEATWSPLIVNIANRTSLNAIQYLTDPAWYTARLAEHGAVLVRGAVSPPAPGGCALFEVMAAALGGESASYVNGNSPRTLLEPGLYTSTEYPADEAISMHNELSYSASWPERLALTCLVGARKGGATPVIDGALWYDAIPERIRHRWTQGFRYIRNLHGGRGLGRSWQQTFETTDRADVDKVLGAMGAEWTWRANDSLSVTQTGPMSRTHPVTDVDVWFCQPDQWHPALLAPEVADLLLARYEVADLPQYVTLASGAPVDPDDLAEVRSIGFRLAYDVDWTPGDLMVLDNLRVGHGRRPFVGDRRVLVSMR